MTTQQALEIAKSETYIPEQWLIAERVLIRAKLCPHCACDGEISHLGRLQESTEDTYAGRECPNCEEFILDSGQDHRYDYDRNRDYDTDAAGMCYSDADPGL
jgi:hypothetical protein